jgi:hypothetical protein
MFFFSTFLLSLSCFLMSFFPFLFTIDQEMDSFVIELADDSSSSDDQDNNDL